MKKISAAFDGLKFSDATVKYATWIGSKSNALLSGVFLDSFLYHSYHLFDMVGSQGISERKIKRLNDADKETRYQAATVFETACQKAGLSYMIHHDKNLAMQELLKESVYSDLLLINKTETFSHFEDTPPTTFISDLLADVQCPVFIVPNKFKKIERVVLLYDGKPSSVFAIKMFNYLMPWMRQANTEVITIADPKESSKFPDDHLIREFITCHYPEASYNVLRGNARDECVEYLKTSGQNALVVLGAYRRSPVSMWFKTSMADVLMEKLDMPLFIAHNK